MKKLFLTSAIALIAVVTMNAQAKFGVKAGYALSNISISGAEEGEKFDAKHTFYVGAVAEYKFTESLALQGEVVYAPLGAKKSIKEEYDKYYVEATSKINLGTLLVPVSLKYYVTPRIAFNGGLDFGIILSKKLKVDVDHNIPSEFLDYVEGKVGDLKGVEEDLKDVINTLNLAPFIGVEYNMNSGLFLDARYNFGLSNLAKETEDDAKTTNSFLQVGVGYKF